MDFWIANDFVCEWDWWYNSIGVGYYIPDILLYGVDGLSKENQDKLLKTIKDTLIYNKQVPTYIKEREVDSTGGNLLDDIISAFKVALVEKDGNTLMWLKSILENELKPFPAYNGWPMDRSDAEGIKEDMSFQQHDQLLYFGGYGYSFMRGVNLYLKYTVGTQFQLSEKALNDYANFILDGIQYATRGFGCDINAKG